MKQIYMLLQKIGELTPKAEMYKLPAIYVGAYAEKDAEITLELWQELKKEIRSSRYKFNYGYGNRIVSCVWLI